MIVRVFFAAVAAAAAALALAGPAAAQPAPIPCGAGGCVYQQLSDDENLADDDWGDNNDDADWSDDWGGPTADNPLGLQPNLGLCGGVDTAIPFVGVYQCLPLIGG
jgi:hypothetical protein